MRTLLIVEDAPNVLKWLLSAIRREVPQIEAVGATNGSEALVILGGDPPDLVVLDLALPAGPDQQTADANVGLGLLDRITADDPHPPVVVLSSLDLEEETLKRGASAFVSKDVGRMWPELRAQLQNL